MDLSEKENQHVYTYTSKMLKRNGCISVILFLFYKGAPQGASVSISVRKRDKYQLKEHRYSQPTLHVYGTHLIPLCYWVTSLVTVHNSL